MTQPMPVSTRTRIKLCGMTREQDVRDAVACGADALGFVFYKPSPRYVTAERAGQLLAGFLLLNAVDQDLYFYALSTA